MLIMLQHFHCHLDSSDAHFVTYTNAKDAQTKRIGHLMRRLAFIIIKTSV